ncbi:MAG: hypothetical protein K2F65_00465 [Eubacterium sp.]|nr:hypothetical protein [Eubacterium sp.]
MGLFGSKKNKTMQALMVHEEGLPNVLSTANVMVVLDETNRTVLFNAFEQKKEITLSIDKITNVNRQQGDRITTKGNATKNAAIGGALFGTTGAVVGATTAKDTQQTIFYDTIAYVSNGEEHTIVLRCFGNRREYNLITKLQQMATPDAYNSSVEL